MKPFEYPKIGAKLVKPEDLSTGRHYYIKDSEDPKKLVLCRLISSGSFPHVEIEVLRQAHLSSREGKTVIKDFPNLKNVTWNELYNTQDVEKTGDSSLQSIKKVVVNNSLIIIITLFVIVSLWLISYTPYWFTRESTKDFYFDDTTGVIGDTIGGITAPFMSALGSILLFMTIWIQIKTNKSQDKQRRHDQVYQSFLHDFEVIRSDIYSITLTVDGVVYSGSDAINRIRDLYLAYDEKGLIVASDDVKFRNIYFLVVSVVDLLLNIDKEPLLDKHEKSELVRKISNFFFLKASNDLIPLGSRIMKVMLDNGIRNQHYVRFLECFDGIVDLSNKWAPDISAPVNPAK